MNARTTLVAFLALPMMACNGLEGGSEAASSNETTASSAASTSREVAQATMEGSEAAESEAAILAIVAPSPADLCALRDDAMADVDDPSCYTSTCEDNVITHVFDLCTGSGGWSTLDGTVVVTAAVTLDAVTAEVVTTDLLVNELAVGLVADVEVPTSGHVLLIADVAVHSSHPGLEAEREGVYTVRVTEDACAGIDGAWTTTIGGYGWQTEVDSFEVCAESCPTGTLWTTSPTEATAIQELTLTFDGNRTADWATDTGLSGQLPLLCALR
jgi:hypothetical protein